VWFDHPRYVPARERLVVALASPPYRFRRLKPVLFLCGAAKSAARDTLHKYLAATQPELGVFYAERVWEAISTKVNIDALQMENQLADLADMVIIIVESAGTFTELGAFAVAAPLRKKLLPILDDQYETHRNSFIATGPVRWINQDSDFAPCIFASHKRVLEAAGEIEQRLRRIKKRVTHLKDLNGSKMHLLFFLCDLVSIIYPATAQMIQAYLARIAPALGVQEVDLRLLLALATAMNLLSLRETHGNSFYFPASLSIISRPYHHVPKVNFGSYRGEHVAVLLTIKDASDILHEIGGLK
jgi:hypothetical protein